MNRNFISSERRAVSVTDQKPNSYFTTWDDHPEYVQIQRTQGTINGFKVDWHTDSFDPNMFLKSKAYIKLSVEIQKRETETDTKNDVIDDVVSNIVDDDKILKKPGMVLSNSCIDARVILNNHEIKYGDLRYITKKLNMSFAGRKINDSYLTTSGGPYDGYTGDYDLFGNTYCYTRSSLLSTFGFDIGSNTYQFQPLISVFLFADLGFSDDPGGPTQNTLTWVQVTGIITFLAGTGGAINLVLTQNLQSGDVIITNSAQRFKVTRIIDATTLEAERLDAIGDFGPHSLSDLTDIVNRNRDNAIIIFGNGGGGDINLLTIQILVPGDILSLEDTPVGATTLFEVVNVINISTVQVINTGNSGFISQQLLTATDFIIQKYKTGGCCDPWHEEQCDDASRDRISGNTTTFLFNQLGFSDDLAGVSQNTLTWVQATSIITFLVGTGVAIDLIVIQTLQAGDIIIIDNNQRFSVVRIINAATLEAVRLDGVGDFGPHSLDSLEDVVTRTIPTFNYTEPLNFGPFNHLSDYGGPLHNSKGPTDIDHKCWYNKMTDLIPYIKKLGISMTFDNIAANSLIYMYGALNNPKLLSVNRRWCRLQDIAITSAELVLFWVKPRVEKNRIPPVIRIQSWQYDH